MYARTNGQSGTTGRSAPRSVVEGGGNERRAHTLALVIAVDLGVHEDRPAAAADVAGDADDLAAGDRLVAIFCLVVLDGHRAGAVGHARHPNEPPSRSSR